MTVRDHAGYELVILSPEHDRSNFTCGVEAMDRYVRQQITQDTKKRLCVATVLVETGRREIVGFFTLSAASVPLHELPEKTRSKLTRQPMVPAILLGRMAVCTSHQKRNLGEFLLLGALRAANRMSRQVGSWAVILDAKGPEVKTFYERYGFKSFPDEPLKMLLPMADVAELFKDE